MARTKKQIIEDNEDNKNQSLNNPNLQLDESNFLSSLNDILSADDTETKKLESLLYNENDAPNQKPSYILITNILNATDKSEWTKNLNGSQINTLLEYLANDEELPDIQLKEIAKNSSAILENEAQSLKSHILDDLERLSKQDDKGLENFNLINKNLLIGLHKRIVPDNKEIDFNNLEPGIYVDLYLKGFLKNMPNVDEIDERLKNVVLTAFIPITVIDKNHKIHFIIPQLKTTINANFYAYYQWLQETLNYSTLNKEDYDCAFACVDYKIVKDANFKIDYIPFNTFAIVKTPAISTSIFSADKLADILSKPDHKELKDLSDDDIASLNTDLNAVRLANKNNTLFKKRLDVLKATNKRFLLDDNTITNLKKLLKIGALNGNVLGNNDLVLNDPQTNYDYKVYSTYDLAKYINNKNVFSYADYDDARMIKKLKNQADKVSKDVIDTLSETSIDYESLITLLNTTQTQLYVSNLKNKQPAENDINFSDFALMKALYSSRSGSDYAYSVYDYAHNIIPNNKKFAIYTYLKQAKIKNQEEFIKWLKNPNARGNINIADYDVIENLKRLYIPNDSFISNDDAISFNNTVYNHIKVKPLSFYDTFNNQLNNIPLVHYDFETISTFFNIVKGQIGKIQLPTQASIVCTDKDLNIIEKDGYESIDIVIDPLKLNQDKDYKNIIDSLYFRMKNLDAKGVVYNKSFESHRLLEMLRYIQDDDGSYAKKVDYINQNTYDLMLFYASSDYKISISELKGKYSIKKLEPYPTNKRFKNFSASLDDKYHLLHYNNLAINRGDFAQLKTLQRLMNNTSDEIWKIDSKELGIYCHNDVVNMIKQIANLKEVNELVKRYLDELNNLWSSKGSINDLDRKNVLAKINEDTKDKNYLSKSDLENMNNNINITNKEWESIDLSKLEQETQEETKETAKETANTPKKTIHKRR